MNSRSFVLGTAAGIGALYQIYCCRLKQGQTIPRRFSSSGESPSSHSLDVEHNDVSPELDPQVLTDPPISPIAISPIEVSNSAIRRTTLPLRSELFDGELEIRTRETNTTPEIEWARTELIFRGQFLREVEGPLVLGGHTSQQLQLASFTLRSVARVVCWMLPRFASGVEVSEFASDTPYISAPLTSFTTPDPPFPASGRPVPATHYEMRGVSGCVDLENWALRGLAGMDRIDLQSFWGQSPLTLYIRDDREGSKAAAIIDHACLVEEAAVKAACAV